MTVYPASLFGGFFSMRKTSRLLGAAIAAALLAACSSGGSSIPTAQSSGSTPQAVRVPINSPFIMYDGHGHIAHIMLTREGMARFRAHRSSSSPLTYHGGPVQTAPQVVLILWGMGTSDPEATILQSFFSNVGGSPWQNIDHQYTQNDGGGFCSSTESNTSICVGNGKSQLTHTVVDGSTPPGTPTQSQVAAEAAKYAKTYGYGPQINYFVAMASGHDPQGFKHQWCAFHSTTGSGSTEVSYTDFPYQTDAGSNCGEGFINSPGTYDGVTIVGGHEYAETQTDPQPSSGWVDSSGSEIGDKCAWLKPPASDQNFNGSTYPVQGLWSDAAGGCAVSY
jgi:serine protease